MLHPMLTTILSPNTPENPSPPADHLVSYEFCFFPLVSLPSPLLARLLAWLERVEKKPSKPLGTRAPNLFLESALFSFKTRKPQGKIGNSGVKGVCFSFSQACLLSCPANVTTTALWGKSVAQTREEKCFSCKTTAKTMGLHLRPVT